MPELKIDIQAEDMRKIKSFLHFDNFQHLDNIEHMQIPKNISIYVLALDKIFIMYQHLFGIHLCSMVTNYRSCPK